MNRIILILVFFSSVFLVSGQEIKNLTPSYVYSLDFSEEAKAGWVLRDTLLSQLESGIKSWDDLNEEDAAILDRYGEIAESIWAIDGGGCSWYCGGGPKEVTASSYLKSQGKVSYLPENAHDLDYKNAWIEGVDGYGIGEFLTYTFSAGAPRITEIIFVNGYVKSEAAYRNNSRVKKLKVYLNNEPFAIITLEDKITNQGFKFEPIGIDDRDNHELLNSMPDWTLKFEILEVYEGLKYDDVAISEIYFDGIDVHCFAKGTPVQMADQSTKNIEDLELGDKIAFIDLASKQIKSAIVEKTERVIHENLVTYTFESGKQITATQDHPFKIENAGWASLHPHQSQQYKGFEDIAQIKIGDVFTSANGEDRLINIEYLEGMQETYTISKLSTGDNFIANGFIVGVEELQHKN